MYGNFKVYPYDSRLEVSDEGWVKNLKSGVVTKGHINKKGYYVFSLTKNKVKRVHDMVLETFVGPCPEGYECGHRNANALDNRLVNLEWVTPYENQHNKLTLNKRWWTKGGIIYVFCIGDKMLKVTESYRGMAKYLGLSDSTTYRLCKDGVSNVNGGRVFKVQINKATL